MARERGNRVYISMVNDATLHERRRYGTVERDIDMLGWDRVDVRFDDLSGITIPVEVELLHDVDETDEHLSGVIEFDADWNIVMRKEYPLVLFDD